MTEGTHQYAPEPGGRHCLTRGPTTSPPPVAIHREGHAPTPHHPWLQHHFDNMEQQAEASTLGMWVFLVTEIMFFGGLFMAYLVYRHQSPTGSRKPATT